MNKELKLSYKRGGAAFLVIVIVMLLLIVALLGGIITYLLKSNQTSKGNNVGENTVIGKLYEDKEWVYTEYSNDSNGKYNVPKINASSVGADKINTQIQADIMPRVKEGIEFEIPWGISYKWYENNNILSLVITVDTGYDSEWYRVYNLNMKTGEICTNSQLLNIKGLSETEFLSKAKVAYGKTFKEKYNNSIEDDFTSEMYDKTINSSNYNVNVPMFLDNTGNLCVIGYIYSIAGAAGYYHQIQITGQNYLEPWMEYILNQNISSITIHRSAEKDNLNTKVNITAQQLENILLQLMNYKLVKSYVGGSGFTYGDIITIAYTSNSNNYELKIANGSISDIKDKALDNAFENSNHTTISGEGTYKFYNFKDYNEAILDEYFK